jgi:predicted phage terminase large subunit-like protein
MLTATSPQISPREAKKEQDRRKLARAKFLYFCKYTDGKFEDALHMTLIADKLEQVARFLQTNGKEGIGRLMILMPPRHGKSEMASRKFPAWLLGRLPDSRIIMASYGADLASKNSRAVRDLLESKRYQALFGGLSSKSEPVELSSDSRSVAAWDLAQPHRGGVVAAGVGGGITGLGADLLILDDLFKNREEAESESRRDLVDDWYKSSALTRLEKEYAAVILFFTHWHPDDLVGRLMKQMIENPQADQWDIVMMPSLSRDDCYAKDADDQQKKMREGVYLPITDPIGRPLNESPLWPNRFGREWLISKEANIGLYEFAALYQQMPYLREGGMFKREYFTIVERVPKDVTLSRFTWYWDKAATVGRGDYSAGVLMAIGSDGMIYVLHAVRGKLSPHDRDNLMISEAKASLRQWQPTALKVFHQKDPAAAGKESAQSTNLKLAQAGLSGAFEPVTGDKEDRAGPWQSSLQGGGVRLLRAAWNEPYIDEHLSFPKGKNDDWVDCSSSCHFKVRVVMMKEVNSYQG